MTVHLAYISSNPICGLIEEGIPQQGLEYETLYILYQFSILFIFIMSM